MPKTKNKKKSVLNKSTITARLKTKQGFLLFVATLAIIGVGVIWKAIAGPTMWLPTADKPLKLAWILDEVTIKDLQTKDLAGSTIPEADVYDIDGEYATKALVDQFHAKGKKVICYIDAGVFEDYRLDADKFPGTWGPTNSRMPVSEEGKAVWDNKPIPYTGPAANKSTDVIGAIDDGWDGSYWLDVRPIAVLEPIMRSRIQMCKDKGFDSVEPDEITSWSNDSGFDLSYEDQIEYNEAVARWAHEAGLSIGLKGDIEQVEDLVDDFDWTLNEECFMYDECFDPSIKDESGNPVPNGLQLFVEQNKAVWIAEYPEEFPKAQRSSTTASRLTQAVTDSICSISKANQFNTAFYKLGLPLNGGRTDCPPFSATNGGGTPVVTNPVVGVSSTSLNPTAPASFTLTGRSDKSATITITLSGNTLKTCNTATTCELALTNYAAGSYTFTVKAVTSDGGLGSSSVTVDVKKGTTTAPNKLPTVSISTSTPSPFDPATIQISASPKDEDGTISKVELYVGDKKVGNDATKAPYNFTLTNYPAGKYSFTAKATDNTGAVSVASNVVTITVNSKPLPPTGGTAPKAPTITGASVAPGWWSCDWSNNCSLTLTWSTVSEASSYVVYRDGKEIGKSITSSFTDKPVASGYSYKYEVYAKNNTGQSPASIAANKQISCFIVCWVN